MRRSLAVLATREKCRLFAAWLNQQFGGGEQVAWAKQDPTRVDIDVPHSILNAWQMYDRVFKRYGRVLYAIYRPTDNRQGTLSALTAMLDIHFPGTGPHTT